MASDIIGELTAALGTGLVETGEAIDPRHLRDWKLAAASGQGPLALVRPRRTEEVAATLRACAAHGVPVVPQGGLTGLAGGATPVPGCVALSLEKMRAVEEVDPDAATITVQAGVTLQAVQEAAEAAGMLFPLDIAGRGSCLIGGNISTNAGGNRVLRYGMTRELVLGLEVVLADGTVLSMMNRMLKNNAGYDLKQAFIGAEGTLGVVTRAVLRLFPQPTSVCTAFLAIEGYDGVLEMLRRARAALGGTLAAFEVMWPNFYRVATEGLGHRPPVVPGHGAYLLLEAMGTDQERDREAFAALVEGALEGGVVADAVLAQSVRESRNLWAVRDASGEFNKAFWPYVSHDVSIPTRRIGTFVEDCTARLRRTWPEVRTVVWGHVADSNIHFGVQTDGRPLPEHRISAEVYACVRDYGGSISAEHGIGLLKKPFLDHSRNASEIEVMRRIRAALDPAGILNPGKVF
ncbi:FAD-binding oxidoreductase [Roseomonas chloroacetimidivorans]|uniref:FAD-binding oxidoreductase n=1 Tax=Roseomonas chloroacetimidivorans TaxID=1766656 RepID=UPI003C70CDF1